jgi:DNA polymerase
MPVLFWDIETRSMVSLEDAGAFRYAADPGTEVLVIAYAVDDGEPQTWIPGQDIPTEFATAASDPSWVVVAHNHMFERVVADYVLGPRYGWPAIPITQQRCAMSMALANALPAALENVTQALALPHQKDVEGHLLMKRMSRPRRDGTFVDGGGERARLALYCKRDVEAERAVYRRLPPLSAAEQALWELDAIINARGFHVDVALAKAARAMARSESAALDKESANLTAGEITSVNQVQRIVAFVRRHGHTLQSLTKRNVAALLADNPSDHVRSLLELRRLGARASTRKFDALLRSVGAGDRLRGTLRFHASSTGRWSGNQFQPQNLKKPEVADLDTAVDAVLAGDLDRVRELGAPLTVAGDVARCAICAAPGYKLIGADFSAIESRVLAWLAGEPWKLSTYRQFDTSGDPTSEPYCVMASQALRRTVTSDDEAGRGFGKTYDLAFGFGGGVGAWRKFDTSDTYSDGEVEQFKQAFRTAHRATVRFWHALERAAHLSVRTGKQVDLASGKLSFTMDGGTLLMTLPSGRRLAYPEARVTAGKFENSSELRYRDNARGGWAEVGAWYGTLTENAVQATARDLLGVALLRVEQAGYPVVLHVHDEVVCEVPEDFSSTDEFQRLMTTPPDWAADLPIAAKVWIRNRYAKSKRRAAPPAKPAEPEPTPDRDGNAITATLVDLIKEPPVRGKIRCPFHDDHAPSLQVYADHYHCFACGAHGDLVDWLMKVEGLDHAEAARVIATWGGEAAIEQPITFDKEMARVSALRLWEEAVPITGTPAARYLGDIRGIDVAALPVDIAVALRFHPRCPFGPGERHPCLLALMTDATTGAATGVQRTALTADARKIDRRMLGRSGVVRLWPFGPTLVVGEGLETTLAAATRLRHGSAPLTPAWAALSANALGKLPVLSAVERLVLLIDHDEVGRAAGRQCTERWRRAGRAVVRLMPSTPGEDFNNLILRGIAPCASKMTA